MLINFIFFLVIQVRLKHDTFFNEVHSIMMFPLLIGRTASKLVN